MIGTAHAVRLRQVKREARSDHTAFAPTFFRVTVPDLVDPLDRRNDLVVMRNDDDRSAVFTGQPMKDSLRLVGYIAHRNTQSIGDALAVS